MRSIAVGVSSGIFGRLGAHEPECGPSFEMPVPPAGGADASCAEGRGRLPDAISAEGLGAAPAGAGRPDSRPTDPSAQPLTARSSARPPDPPTGCAAGANQTTRCRGRRPGARGGGPGFYGGGAPADAVLPPGVGGGPAPPPSAASTGYFDPPGHLILSMRPCWYARAARSSSKGCRLAAARSSERGASCPNLELEIGRELWPHAPLRGGSSF